jgi:hypothetical protein
MNSEIETKSDCSGRIVKHLIERITKRSTERLIERLTGRFIAGLTLYPPACTGSAELIG